MSVMEALVGVDLWWNLLAVAVLVLGVGRFARVVTYDDFPPAQAVRQWWVNVTVKLGADKWASLAMCQWCFTPWAMLAAGSWYVLSLYVAWFAYPWWILWGWLAISYVASMVVARDDPGA